MSTKRSLHFRDGWYGFRVFSFLFSFFVFFAGLSFIVFIFVVFFSHFFFAQMTEKDQTSMALLAKLLDIDEMQQVRWGKGYRNSNDGTSSSTRQQLL